MVLLEAEDQKQLGDQAYKASCFTQAIAHYTAAISLGGDVQSIYSNRSASRFECGDYLRCLDDARRAFELDATSNLAPKVALRAARACFWSADLYGAKSWLKYADRINSCAAIGVLQAQLDSAAEEPWLAHDSSASAWSEIPLHRPGIDSSSAILPAFSTSDARSLLRGYSTSEDGVSSAVPQVPLCNAQANELVRAAVSPDTDGRQELHILISDCHDLRHLWCSLVDAARRCPRPQALRLHITLCSRAAEDLCRAITLLHALSRVSPAQHQAAHTAARQAAPDIGEHAVKSRNGTAQHTEATTKKAEATAQHTAQHEEAAAYFWHLSASSFLCPAFSKRTSALVADLAAAEACPLPHMLPFVRMHAQQWPEARQVFCAWAEARLSPEEARAQVREMRRRSTLSVPPQHALAGMQPFLEGLEAVADQRPDGEIASEMRAKLGATAADCTPKAIQTFRSELKTFMRSQWANAHGLQRFTTLAALPGTHRGDQGYALSLLRLPLPPRLRAAFAARPHCSGSGDAPEPVGSAEKYADATASAAREDPEQELVGFGAADPEAGEELFAGLAGAEAGWEANVTLTRVLPDSMHEDAPRVEATEAAGLAELAHLMQTPEFSDISQGKEGGMRAHEYALAVVGRMAKALKTLIEADALRIQVVLGDAPGGGLIDGRSRSASGAADGGGGGDSGDANAGAAAAAEPRFDRIHLGRVPDRVGLLAALLGGLPRLKRAPHALLTHAVACGTAADDDYEAYAQGHTCAPCITAAGELLGARFCGGGMWGVDACWAPAAGPPDLSLVTASRLKLWLHKVVHACIFPRAGDGLRQPTEQPTLNMLQPLMALLSRRFPPHWLQRALDPLWNPVKPPYLPLTFPARPSSRTPSRSPPRPPATPGASAAPAPFCLLGAAQAWTAWEKHLETADAAPARTELRALGALWLPRLPCPLAAVLSTSSLSCAGRVCLYEVCVSGARPAEAGSDAAHGGGAGVGARETSGHSMHGGDDGSGDAAALGVIVYHPQLARQRGGGRGLLCDVRRALRNGRAAVADGISLHSAGAVDRRGGAVFARWPMAADDFEQRVAAGHACACFRLDTWMTVVQRHVSLSKATPVATLCE